MRNFRWADRGRHFFGVVLALLLFLLLFRNRYNRVTESPMGVLLCTGPLHKTPYLFSEHLPPPGLAVYERLRLLANNALPNPGHVALARLARAKTKSVDREPEY
jgi:hypothetical protein